MTCGLLIRMSAVSYRRDDQPFPQAEERDRLLFDSNPHPVWVYDLETLRFLDVNRAAIEKYGYSHDEFLSMTIKDIRPSEEIPALMEGIAEVAEGAGVMHHRMRRHRRKDGTLIEVDGASHAITFKGRNARVVVATDITERKRAEVALRQSEARYHLLFDSNPHPVWVYDLQTLAILDVNDSAVRNYGYSREEFLSLTIKDIRPPEDIPALVASAAKAPPDTEISGAWKHRKKDGTVIDVEITSRPLVYGGRDARLVAAIDITARKKAETALRQSEERFRFAMHFSSVGMALVAPDSAPHVDRARA